MMKNISEPDSGTYCIFQQPWWLESVTPGQWDVIRLDEGGEAIASLPYWYRQKSGLKLMMMPPLTQVLGPWLADLPGKYATRLSRQKELMNSLIGQLPPFDYFKQNFHYSIDNWLPFYWNGFEQTTRYTYVLEDLSDIQAVWKGFTGSTRREIRKAEKELSVSQDDQPDLMWKLHRATLKRHDESPIADREIFGRIFQSAKDREAGQLFVARDNHNHVHAAVFLVWDKHSAYYLMGGADAAFRRSGAQSLLIWEAIQFAAVRTGRFDFEGSMIEPIERFFRGFGARQKPYFQVTKMSKKMHLLMSGKDVARKLFS